MASVRSLFLLAALGCLLLAASCVADSRGNWGVPPPGFAYGGLPYGSVSGGVASYYSGTPQGAVLPAYSGSRSFGGVGNFLRR